MCLSALDLAVQQVKLKQQHSHFGRCAEPMLSPDLSAMIGVSSPDIQCWGAVDADLLRRFSQALMDPDPRYWDMEFAESTPQKGLSTPPLMATCLERRRPPGDRDILAQNGFSDDSSSLDPMRVFQGLPTLPTLLRRIARIGVGIEVFSYPSIGNQIFVRHSYASIAEGTANTSAEEAPTLLIAVESAYRNQDDRLLCKITTQLARR